MHPVVTTEDIYAFGNSTGPREARPIDLGADPVGPFSPETPLDMVLGASAFRWPEDSGLTGKVWLLRAGTVLPPGLAIHADGSDVGGTNPKGHRTIYPTARMSHETFRRLIRELDWQRGW